MSNVFSFSGAVGRDAEVKYTPNGNAVLNVAVANNVGFGDRQQTMWVQVAVWGKRAEGELANYLLKGQQVFVSGELTMEEYQANDGTTKSSMRLNANVIDLVGSKRDNNQGQQNNQQNNNQGQQNSQQNNQNNQQNNQQPRQQNNQQQNNQNNQQRQPQQRQGQNQMHSDDFDDEIPF